MQGANPEVHLINQLRDTAVRIVIGQQIVDQPQHHIVTHHLIAVDSRGVEHRRLALVVAEVVADVGAENAVVCRRFVQYRVDLAERRIACSEGIHHSKIGVVRGVTSPGGGHLLVILRHLHVCAGTRRHRVGDAQRPESIELLIRQADARIEGVVGIAPHLVHGETVRQRLQRGGVHNGLHIRGRIGERGVLGGCRHRDDDSKEDGNGLFHICFVSFLSIIHISSCGLPLRGCLRNFLHILFFIEERYAFKSAAFFGPMTAANSGSVAALIFATLLNSRNSLVFNTFPIPGASSNTEAMLVLARRLRWWVMPKRCTSSRTCCNSFCASERLSI